MSEALPHRQGNSVLLVAFHFPPQSGSSGLLRTLKYARYLPEFGWLPVVLTANPRAYESIEHGSDKQIPPGVPVIRAFALDARKHLSVRGAYFDWTALPDRWSSWILGAFPAGVHAIWKHRIQAIFSTFPIATSILIGLLLHVVTGKPWIVDLRDSMTEDEYPKDPRTRRVCRWIERQAMRRAACVIFTAPSTKQMYLKRYPDLSPEKCLVISNGFDEEDFTGLDLHKPMPIAPQKQVRLLHTGTLYPEERDPRPFFQALSRLKKEGCINKSNLNIAFRAPGTEELYTRLIQEEDLGEIVELQPRVPYRQSLQECADADGLLLFQAANCDHQIPAKAYEYLRLQKPILAMTTHAGDTAALLKEVGGATIVNLADEQEIYQALPGFLAALRAATHPLPDLQKVRRYARRNQAEQLSKCLTGLLARASTVTSVASSQV